MNKRFAVVGGSCVDIFATPALPLVKYDSNPGDVNIGFGGVGRNIAENLALLKQDVLLIAPFGQDPFSAQMLEHTNIAGVNTEHCPIARGESTPYYIAINDSQGDMYAAVNDMKICDLITPTFLSQKLDVLNECGAVILDANIPAESIDYLAVHCSAPLFADAVSTKKAMKLARTLPHLHTIKTNLQEAEALLGNPVNADLQSLEEASGRFHDKGIEFVLITLGKKGAFISSKGVSMISHAAPVDAVNANGCGDAFSAAAFLMIMLRKEPADILETALAAAAATAQSTQAVSADLYNEIKKRIIIQDLRIEYEPLFICIG